MRVVFKTTINHYRTNCFPENIEIPPRIGETIRVTRVFEQHYSDKKLPIRLEVVDVIWTEYGVICKLWYKKQDVEAAKLSGTNLF